MTTGSDTSPEGVPIREVPPALERREEVRSRLDGRPPAVFLDYDGTLTPIVDDPADATLPRPTRRLLRELSDRCPVAVVSGRDLPDVRRMVDLPGLVYAGSHGFDIRGPDGLREERAPEYLPDLAEAESELREALGDLPGVRVERKRFAVAVHFRRTPPGRVPEVRRAVEERAGDSPRLRLSGGKKIFELRPAVEWDKGRALLWILDVLELDPADHCPVYVGDDVTDEDAFRAIRSDGLPVVVRGEDDERRTLARFALPDPDAVGRFLALLADWTGDGSE